MKRRPSVARRAPALTRPVLFVTNHVPPDRAGAFAALHAREGLELALFGGRSHHATAGLDDPGVPFTRVRQRDVHRLAGSGRYRAVVAGTAGRVALPAAWRGARHAQVPFLLWSALWGELLTPAHIAARPLMAAIYRNADAVVAYGSHVAAFARGHGARTVVIAPQAVDNEWWSAPVDGQAVRYGPFQGLFVGRAVWEKGARVLLQALRASGLERTTAAFVLVGGGPSPLTAPAGEGGPSAVSLGPQPPERVRQLYAGSDVLVVPSLPTRTFREPWGLVVNEAMNQRCAIITTDAVGAAAGGLVRDGETGLVVPAGDPDALGAALRRLHDDPALRARLADAGAREVRSLTFDRWAEGFSAALTATGASRSPC